MSEVTRVAVIGLGESGSRIAAGLHSAGLAVIGFDNSAVQSPPVAVAASMEEAVAGAQIVISLNSVLLSRRMAEQIAPLLGADAVFADLNTGTPEHKRRLAGLFAAGAFADVAVMAPGAGPAGTAQHAAAGSTPPLAVAGTGARRFIELLEPFGVEVEYVSEVPGAAAARALLGSILEKGLAGVLIDVLWAAESMGQKDWAYGEILREFESSSGETAKRYLSDTAQHLKRRQIEMMDVVEMLRDADYDSTTVSAIQTNYSRILHGKKIPFSKAP